MATSDPSIVNKVTSGTSQFVKKREIAKITGISGETFKKYRLSGRLSENIHWIRVNSKVVLYNVPLILDWLRNINHPEIHQQAIDTYQEMMLPDKKGRRIL
ncbi:MAG: hypothetical protein MUF49_19930 [Oculatellaceae cyanobacterium Prado106]|jgi:hypothetical protein|nr:hypothetical protein [Oculatellaceae cyanobacterium Prado106]